MKELHVANMAAVFACTCFFFFFFSYKFSGVTCVYTAARGDFAARAMHIPCVVFHMHALASYA